MAIAAITDMYVIKSFDNHSCITIRDIESDSIEKLTDDDASMFNIELKTIKEISKNRLDRNNRIDILCGHYV